MNESGGAGETVPRIEGKNIVLGVTGGIAVYKACELVRGLVKLGGDVHVVMTKNAVEFVTPLTFQTLSGNGVAVDTFDLETESEIGHIALADRSDLIVVAPATANVISKAALGIADNLLTTVLLASTSPVIFCPAMNVNMYRHPAVQENLQTLKTRGATIVEPAEGELACGWEGMGRLEDVDFIIDHIERAFAPKDLTGEKVVVTAGATREFIDPVRFISNPATGKMGFAVAKEAWMRGAEVVLVSGHADVKAPKGVEVIHAESAAEMRSAVMGHLNWATVVIKAAAVGDYIPQNTTREKIKKESKGGFVLGLKKSPDILREVGRKKNGKIVVGFAAETGNLLANAVEKLKKKNADLIVANDVTSPGAGFGADTNKVHFVDRNGNSEELPLMTKAAVAERILNQVVEMKRG